MARSREYSDQELSYRYSARNYDRVCEAPTTASQQSLVFACGHAASLQRWYRRQAEKGEISQERAETFYDAYQGMIDEFRFYISQQAAQTIEHQTEAEMIARSAIEQGRSMFSVAREFGLCLQEIREYRAEIEEAMQAERELLALASKLDNHNHNHKRGNYA